MASVNFGEKEFTAVASAAHAALRRGNREDAVTLNELARKMNNALSNAIGSGVPRGFRSSKAFDQSPGPIDAELGIKRGASGQKGEQP